MIWSELSVSGCYSGSLRNLKDSRGSFQKIYNSEALEKVLPGFLPRECYVTTSARGVLRGMHFQLPPYDHAKIVTCLSGHVLDVIVDLRPGQSYGRAAEIELSSTGTNCVVIPKGFGHGFYSYSDNTQLLYLVETSHVPRSDAGLLWNSINANWPNLNPILSERDQSHPTLAEFNPPNSWAEVL